jgi:hypothetical protein
MSQCSQCALLLLYMQGGRSDVTATWACLYLLGGLRDSCDRCTLLSESFFIFSYLRTFIRIHWYTVPPTFQFTVWEDGFDYIVFFLQMGILDMIQHFMHEILIGSSQYFTSYYIESRHLCEILKRVGLVGQ